MSDDQPPLPGSEPPRRPAKRPRGGGSDANSRLTQALLRLDELETRTRQLADENARLRTDVDRMRGLYDHAPPPFHWDDLEPDERERLEGQLHTWVTDVLRLYCPDTAQLLKPCWWQHLPVRRRVTAVWLAWLGGYRHAKRKHADPEFWDRVVLPALDKFLPEHLGNPRDPCEVHNRRTQQAGADRA